MGLTTEQRDALPSDDFAVPEKRALPIHDETHVKLAHSQVDRTEGLSPEEKAEAKRRISDKAKALGIDTSGWSAAADDEPERLSVDLNGPLQFEAMAIQMPTVDDHPNRVPFKGVLTRVDMASDAPPGGSGGKRVLIPKAVAEKALPSLMGMAVDFTAAFDNHDPQQKIGIITGATVEGTEIRIEGFFYGADFPKEVAVIKTLKEKMGFSFEAMQIQVADVSSDPMIVESLTFTGAAVLLKDKAAYRTTSISASAEGSITVSDMDILKAELAKITEGLGLLSASVQGVVSDVATLKEEGLKAASVLSVVKPHADALRACADGMSAAAIGMHEKFGHATKLRAMADSMEAEAALGKMPHVYSDHSWRDLEANAEVKPAEVSKVDVSVDLAAATKPLLDQIAALSVSIESVKASAQATSVAPERKTIAGDVRALLAKAGFGADLDNGDKIAVSALDKALKDSGVDLAGRLSAKSSLAHSGMLDEQK